MFHACGCSDTARACMRLPRTSASVPCARRMSTCGPSRASHSCRPTPLPPPWRHPALPARCLRQCRAFRPRPLSWTPSQPRRSRPCRRRRGRSRSLPCSRRVEGRRRARGLSDRVAGVPRMRDRRHPARVKRAVSDAPVATLIGPHRQLAACIMRVPCEPTQSFRRVCVSRGTPCIHPALCTAYTSTTLAPERELDDGGSGPHHSLGLPSPMFPQRRGGRAGRLARRHHQHLFILGARARSVNFAEIRL